MYITNYPLDRIDFRPWAQAVLGSRDLGKLHLSSDPLPFESYVERLNFYKSQLAVRFGDVAGNYASLVSHVSGIVGGLELRQNPPSFRCHLSGAGTSSSMHRDGETKYGITKGALNVWVPLTPVADANSLYVESRAGQGDLRPLELKVGQMVIFDAYHLLHGSYRNTTESTRISFDFRFLPHNTSRTSSLGIHAAPLSSNHAEGTV